MVVISRTCASYSRSVRARVCGMMRDVLFTNVRMTLRRRMAADAGGHTRVGEPVPDRDGRPVQRRRHSCEGGEMERKVTVDHAGNIIDQASCAERSASRLA